MENTATEESDEKPPLEKDERESLIACVTDVLKEEKDDEVLESIAEVVQDLRQNVGMRDAFKSFRKTGWAFIKRTKNSKNEFQLEGASSSVMILDNGQPKLESRLDHETHPIRNEIILKKIFGFSSVEDLKNIRLVSRKWRDLSLNSWRGKAVICVNKIQSDQIGYLIQDGSGFWTTPFKRFKVDDSSHFPNFEQIDELLNMFRSSAQYTNLNVDDSTALESVLAVFNLPHLRAATLQFPIADLLKDYDLFISGGGVCPFQDMQPRTPNLRKLELNMKINEVIYEPRTQFPWKKIFENLPTLNSLLLKYTHEGPENQSNLDRNNLKEMMRSLCEVRMERNFSILNLEELDIFDTGHPMRGGSCLDDDIATHLIQSKFPLQRLCIVLGRNTNPSAFSTLLKECGETLQYLKCNNSGNGHNLRPIENNVLNFPSVPFLPSKVVLPNLKEIVFANILYSAFHALGSFDVPNLETLRIEKQVKPHCGCETETGVRFDSQRIVPVSETFFEAVFLPSLSKFFYTEEKIFSSVELKGLAKAMPNIIDLGIPVGDIETFPMVYKLWPRLQSLHVFASDRTYLHFDDYAVTGLPVEDNWDNDDLDDGPGAEPRASNITNLKDLRKFVLQTKLVMDYPRPRRVLITDLSAVYGFLQLPKLRILHLETMCWFSTKVRTALEMHLFELKVEDPEHDKRNTDSPAVPAVNVVANNEDDGVSDSDDSSG